MTNIFKFLLLAVTVTLFVCCAHLYSKYFSIDDSKLPPTTYTPAASAPVYASEKVFIKEDMLVDDIVQREGYTSWNQYMLSRPNNKMGSEEELIAGVFVDLQEEAYEQIRLENLSSPPFDVLQAANYAGGVSYYGGANCDPAVRNRARSMRESCNPRGGAREHRWYGRAATVSEPSTWVLVLIGAIALVVLNKRKRV